MRRPLEGTPITACVLTPIGAQYANSPRRESLEFSVTTRATPLHNG